MNLKNLTIGILGIHGSIEEHEQSLKNCGVKSLRIKNADDLDLINGLIIPGGESTTMGKLMDWYGIAKILKQKIDSGLPVYGTCAGAILLAKKISGPQRAQGLEVMNIEIERNAYGRQTESFETTVILTRPESKKVEIPAVFIRAPRIKSVGKNVEILAELNNEPILVQEKNLLAGTFHPELTDDLSVHEYFLALCQKQLEKS